MQTYFTLTETFLKSTVNKHLSTAFFNHFDLLLYIYFILVQCHNDKFLYLLYFLNI